MVTDTKKMDTSSRQNLVVNADGTTDAYFVPDSPGADLETNWVKTNPGESWFAYFRCYGSLQPYFDKTWVLPNLEKCRNPCQGYTQEGSGGQRQEVLIGPPEPQHRVFAATRP